MSVFAVFPSPLGAWDAFTLIVEGEIDAAAGPVFANAIQAAVAVLAGRRLVLDFAGVTYMDSIGLRALSIGYTVCQQAGSTLVLRRVPPMVRRVLAASHLADVQLIDGD